MFGACCGRISDSRLSKWGSGDSKPGLFDAIDNPLLRIPGGERGERSLMCASVLWGTDRLVSRLVSNPSFG
jgi:hypothetical protein